MDDVSMRTMQELRDKHLLLSSSAHMRVLDVGSMDAQGGQYGTYRKLFSGNAYTYVGLDIEEGPNVDLVVEEHYSWGIEGEYDVVISGQCLEHVEYPWLTMEQIALALKPGGLHFNIVPSTGPVHRFPIDTYRYHPDGMRALAVWAGLEVVEIQSRIDSIWNNTVLVARRPNG